MYTRELYYKILTVIEDEIHLPDGWLLSRKTEDATDARCFLCHYLSINGVSSGQIQKLTGLKKSTVNKQLLEFEDRIKRRQITSQWKEHIETKLRAKKVDV